MPITAGHLQKYSSPPAQCSPSEMNIVPPAFNPDSGDDPQDRSLPKHMTRDLASPRPSPSNPVGRRLAFLFRLHPAIDREFQDVSLLKLSTQAKNLLLSKVESRLGIV